jgi:DNA-binding Xre family transcriptional regulator
VKSNFLYLLAEKQRHAGRSISLRAVARDTGLNDYTVRGFAYNSLSEYPKNAIQALCNYFGCDVGDLLKMEEQTVDDQPVT